MRESVKIRRAMLSEHVGKNVTIILDAQENSVFQGVLSRRQLSGLNGGECWIITSPRGAMQRGAEIVPVPETKIYFVAEDLKHVVVPQETAEEAAEKIEQENAKSRIFTPGGSSLQ